MADKHMRRFSTSYVIRELQIKTTMRYSDIPIRMAKIQNTDIAKCWPECEAPFRVPRFIPGGKAWVQPLQKTAWQFLTKLNILLPYDPAIVLLAIYPNELKTYFHTETYTWMFIAALFIIANIWKQPRCPSVGEWINKLWYIQSMEYDSALKRNELSRHKKTWGNLKCILLSERSQSEKALHCMIPTFWKRQIYRDSEKISGCQGLEGERDEYAGHRRFFGQ